MPDAAGQHRRRWLRPLLLAVVPALLLGATVVVAAAGGAETAPVMVAVPPTATPSPIATPSPTPEPTPRPYAGPVAHIAAPALGIDHDIEEAVIVANQMQPPVDGIYAVGWYPGLGRPGYGYNSVFSAHETWSGNEGPFYSLHLAAPGDALIVTMGDGTQYHYEVISNVRYDVSAMPMGEIIWPSTRPGGEEWITLITCGGRFVQTHGTYGEYLDRDVVVARRVAAAHPEAPSGGSAVAIP